VAVKNRRIRIYLLEDVGVDGAVDMQYVRQPSGADDEGYWGGLAYTSAKARVVGAQLSHEVLYDVPMDVTVPLENSDDAIITILGAGLAEIKMLQVLGVGHLEATTNEKIARCIEVSDAVYTLTT
jgi:hypothetical protein